MNNFFIYQFVLELKKGKKESITVIFFPDTTINHRDLRDELKDFFSKYLITNKIFAIGGEYLKESLIELLEQSSIFSSIIGFRNEILSIVTFNETGKLQIVSTSSKSHYLRDYQPYIERYGLLEIFKKREGLVETAEGIHFVFPSGKHCSKFIRTGNVLQNSAEIYFASFVLLKHLDGEFEDIYCDTSSINILAFTAFELKRRLNNAIIIPRIKSFGSYKGFEATDEKFNSRSKVLISCSTSGGIIGRLLDKQAINVNQIIVIYFLGDPKVYEDKILCNLTQSENFSEGIPKFDIYYEGKCSLCENHSIPILIQGDVFLSINPKVNKITFGVKDKPQFIEDFIKEFQSIKKNKRNAIKCFYKESEVLEENYEVYIDIAYIMDNIDNYSLFKINLLKAIDTYIPASVKYLIYLPDEPSRKLTDFIYKYISNKLNHNSLPEIIEQKEIENKISKENNGSVVVVASSIVNGRHSLYISRALRDFEKLTICYFVAFNRPNCLESTKFIKDNISRGWRGNASYPVISVQSIFCSSSKEKSSWEHEKNFFNNFSQYLKSKNKSGQTLKYITKRLKVLGNNRSTKGLANKVFLPSPLNSKELFIRKNFAFLQDESYFGNASQADIYFVISSIINSLRYSGKQDRSLEQSQYVRNIIAPENFQRFNDGIIQASILRAASGYELDFQIDNGSSNQMLTILESMVDQYDTVHGESLIEFLFCLGTKKMKLLDSDFKTLLERIKKTVYNEIIIDFVDFIEFTYEGKNIDVQESPM